MELNEEFRKNLIEQVSDLWINPEIERRREAGRLPDDFVLRGVQVIMNLDTDAPEIRFNEEVQAVVKAQAARPIEEGEDVTEADLSGVQEIELTDHDPNAAHLTMIAFQGSWLLAFDFRYNATRVAETVEAAREFLDCAAFALESNRIRAFVDNLFSATELMAKGHLLLSPDERLLTSKSHSIISSTYNLEGKRGHTDPRYVDLLNRLKQLRGPARYLDKDPSLSAKDYEDMLDVAEDMYETVRDSVPQRHRVSEDS